MSFNDKLNGPVKIIAELEIQNNPDLAVVDSNRVRGGRFSVADLATRNLLPVDLRKANVTICYVESDNTEWVLRQGIDNADWQPYGSGSSLFNGNRPITRQGLPFTGQVMGGETLGEFEENLWFPALSESAQLLAPNAIRRKGASTAVALQWKAIRGTNPLVSIVVAGEAMTPTGNTQNGTKNVNTLANTNTIYTMEVSDGQTPQQSSVSINYMSDRFWGKLGKNYLGAGLDATTLQDFMDTPPTDAQIRALNGAGIGTGSELSNSLVQNRNGINGAGEFLAFHWPSTFGTPVFVINGLPNSAYTKVRTSLPFTNADGFTENGDLWMSNTAQNSPIATFQINRAA